MTKQAVTPLYKYSNHTIQPTRDPAGATANKHPTKGKKERKDDKGGLTKRRRPATVAPSPKKYHHARGTESTSTKQHLQERKSHCCQTSTLVLGFPQHRGRRIQGSHDALQEGKMQPEGGTASVSDEPTRISPEDPIHTPGRSIAHEPHEDEPRDHQTSRPPPCAKTSSKPPSSSHRSSRHEVCKTEVKRKVNRA